MRPHIHVYPEITEDAIIRKVWHAEKWRKSLDLDVLSPMYDAGNLKHYFVFELSRLSNGQYVIPLRWINVVKNSQKTVHADAYYVTVNKVSLSWSHSLKPLQTIKIGCLPC